MNYKRKYYIEKIGRTIRTLNEMGLQLLEDALVVEIMKEAIVDERTAKKYITEAKMITLGTL